MAISEAEFQNLWESYGGSVRAAIARNRIIDPATSAEDIEQEVMLSVWHSLQGETNVLHPASYLRQVTQNALIDAVRRANAREASRRADGANVEQLSDNSSSQVTETQARSRELQSHVKQAMAELTANRRRAVALRLNGMTAPEIARLCGWAGPKTRNLIYRGMEQLRAHLKKRGIDIET